MKVLISTAVWGEEYCSVFVRFSLGTLLSPGNIPALAKRADITFHIVTREQDRETLLRDAALEALQSCCTVEWDLIEDFGIVRPPEGPGGEKYPFLSALQNLSIVRAMDHDVISFNYADFVWQDGSLSNAVAMLEDGGAPCDAVFSFCLPVDRESAVRVLERHRPIRQPWSVHLAPRDGAKLAVNALHREARARFWSEPRFTVTPSYIIWPVDDYGVLIRAYHQSILAMRVRRDDPEFCKGIRRGSLDSSFGAQLASKNLTFATDSDKILVFSLYDTPVDSRLPIGVTRDMSLRAFLEADVTPEQRRFAERPIYIRCADGQAARWESIAAESGAILKRAEDATWFRQSRYDRNLATHGIIPEMVRLTRWQRRWRPPLIRAWHSFSWMVSRFVLTPIFSVAARARHIVRLLTQPRRLHAAVGRQLSARPEWRNFARVWSALGRPRQLPGMIKRVVEHRLRLLPLTLLGTILPRRKVYAAPGLWVDPKANDLFLQAISVESASTSAADDTTFRMELSFAERNLRQAMSIEPTWIEPARALGRNLWFQGRFDDALEVFNAAERLRDTMAGLAGRLPDTCIFLPNSCVQSIGLLGHLDAFVKYKILSGDQRPYYLIAPPEKVINKPFLEYWDDYVTIVSSPQEIESLRALQSIYSVNWNWVLPKDGRLEFVHEGIAAIQQAWDSAGRSPLLRLKPQHEASLRAVVAKWGMADTDKFVCLHVRSEGFYREVGDASQRFRNTPIDSYYPMIRDLADRGIWVVRMGDPSMPPLDPVQCGTSGRVIDYALSPERSAEIDVALCARCELFISSPSGLHTVAHAFGSRVCEVNYPIYKGFPWHREDVFIPQFYYSHDKGRVLSLPEILGSNIFHLDHHFLLERAGISLLPNDPEDILEVVREALAPSTYKVADPQSAERVRIAFDDLNSTHKVGIRGRLGQHFAAKYCSQLLPSGPLEVDLKRTAPRPKPRKLDFLLAVYNRPNYLYQILKTGLALNIPGAYFVVFDDASNAFEHVPDLGLVTSEMVCRSFNDERIIYIRNPQNMGIAKTLESYYRDYCEADYTSLLNPKDEFIDSAPIINAIAKLDSDPTISMVIYPLRQIDRVETDKPLLFNYNRMSGREFIYTHVRDNTLQHCAGYAVMRVEAMRRCGTPRNLDLRAYGLEDASGIDHEMLYSLATTGDVDFESEPVVRRSIIGGYTERFPLTFAYCQYQYARRLMKELEPKGYVSAETRKLYLGFWHLIIARGLVVAYQHVHGSEQEKGVSRIRQHLPMPILLYLPMEALRFRIWPSRETVSTYFRGARLLLADWWNKINGRPHIA